MSRVLLAAGLLALVPGHAWCDAIVLNGSNWVNLPSDLVGSLGSNSPYWDNNSTDGSRMNAGFFLTGTGGFSGGTNYNPLQYLGENNGAGNPDAPDNLSILHTTNPVSLTLLDTITADHSLVLGFYNANAMSVSGAVATEVPIFGPGALSSDIGSSVLLNIANGADYGFYLTRCLVYASGTNSTCLQSTTWFSNTTFDLTDAGHQHFTVFNSSNPNILYFGVEDWTSGGPERYGDYNDIIFELNSSPTPEPATFALIGVGLIGIGIRRRKTLWRTL